MQFYEQFENNIDDINNIISVCPTCHRKMHLGKHADVEPIITSLWNARKEQLRNSDIFIEIAGLKKMYFD